MIDFARQAVRSLIPSAWRRKAKDLLGMPRIMHDDFALLHRIGNLSEPHIVFDVGAFEGWFALCWLEYNPTARIYCFEPTSSTFHKKLKPNLGNDHRVTLEQAACGAQNGTLLLHQSEFAAANSFLNIIPDAELNLKFETSSIVHVIRLEDYVHKFNIHDIKLVKIDVQGFEMEVLKGMGEILDCIEYIYIESSVHPVYDGASIFCDVFNYLTTKDFLLVDLQGTDLGTSHLRECDLLFRQKHRNYV